MSARFALHGTDGSLQILELAGREGWALSHLLAVGDGKSGSSQSAPPLPNSNVLASKRSIDSYILRSKVERLSDLQVAA